MQYILSVNAKADGALPSPKSLPPYYSALLVNHSDPKKNGPFRIENAVFAVHGDFVKFTADYERVEVTVMDEGNIYALGKPAGAVAGTYDQAWTLGRPMPESAPPEPPEGADGSLQ